MARYSLIGTSGHVDHGKSTLIQALTGTDPDRLREEKERGITIDLGFAAMELPDGSTLGFIDVPGHERFVHNMLAGIGGIDLVLLVVDVQEGVMPQTREHLQILQLLGIPRGIIVLTKCDLVEPDWVEIVTEEVREAVAGTFLAQAPVCPVSVRTGAGLDVLRTTLLQATRDLPPRPVAGPVRLPLDRAFSRAGFGTVVTGTLLSGMVRPGAMLECLPGGQSVRVRDLQIHGRSQEAAVAGQRVALNLGGVALADVARGTLLATPGVFRLTERLDIRLQLLADAPRPLRLRDPVHLFLGTARVTARVIPLDSDQLRPGDSALVQLQLDQPLPAHRGDRLILRSYSPVTTIGGGVVIDPHPLRHKRFRPDVLQGLRDLEAGDTGFVLQKVTEAGALTDKVLNRTLALGAEALQATLQRLRDLGKIVPLGDCWTTPAWVAQRRQLLLDHVGRQLEAAPMKAGVPRAELQQLLGPGNSARLFDALLQELAAAGHLELADDLVRPPGHRPRLSPPQQAVAERLLAAFRAQGLKATAQRDMIDRLGLEEEDARPLLEHLCQQGMLRRLSADSLLAAEAYAEALGCLQQGFAAGDTLTLAAFRDRAGCSRKLAQAFLEHCDSRKYTRRQGDARLPWQLPYDLTKGTGG